MRLIFAGTPEFAAPALTALIAAKHEAVLALTQPDRPAGRGMQLVASAVKRLALEQGIEVFQPVSLKSPDAQKKLAEVKADAMIVAAYGLILPQAVLDLPRLGCINIHASLLPRWRGAAPIQRAILAGDTETGITIMQMEAGLDTGPMLMQVKLPITPDDTAATLHDKLARQGAELIVAALARIETGKPSAIPQPMEGVTYAEKILKQEAAIDWTLPANQIERRIRALQPFPVMQTSWRGEMLRIWRATPIASATATPGVIQTANDQLIVACGSGALEILELQRGGGKRLAARDFLRGATLAAGDQLGH
ncbi:MAG: methionyl-tRNA formyltransferase [Burkholderiales bacterium]